MHIVKVVNSGKWCWWYRGAEIENPFLNLQSSFSFLARWLAENGLGIESNKATNGKRRGKQCCVDLVILYQVELKMIVSLPKIAHNQAREVSCYSIYFTLQHNVKDQLILSFHFTLNRYNDVGLTNTK